MCKVVVIFRNTFIVQEGGVFKAFDKDRLPLRK